MTHCCPQCGSAGTVLYADQPDRLMVGVGRWDVAQCPGCGLWWIVPPPAPDAIATFYGRYHTHLAGTDRTSGFQAAMTAIAVRHRLFRRPIVQRWLARSTRRRPSTLPARLVQYLTLALPVRPQSDHRTLLDIGAGNGWFLRMMGALGWDVHGCEPDAAAARVAVDRAGVPVRPSVVTADLWPPHTFSAITMRHVIEHLLDPLEVLDTCANLLEPGGWLSILCPNTGSRGAQRFGPYWRGLEVPRHVRLYDPTNLAQLVTSTKNFAILHVRTINLNAWWFGWSSERLRGTRSPLVSAVGMLRRDSYQRGMVDTGEEILLLARRTSLPVNG